KRRSSTRRRTGKNVKDDDGEGGNESVRKDMNDPRRKRGRPPRVDTPMEVRVKNVLKALRKLKDEASGNLRINAFEKLPEKKEFPEYFQEIKNPIALDLIRKNVKRREYKTFDQFIADMELMFENAKAFNEDDSQLYQDAVMLQEEMRKAAEIEKARKDEDITGGDEGAGGGGKQLRLPLDHIPHKGENYRVGDWIHIINPNDPNKPTVGQIFRTWKDHDGQIWINACWYYRPEQTVHWENKKFYPDEVVKTGQYRDHHIDEVLGKCFVMFFTRYSRGRPKGIDPKRTPIYVCESRYNEVEKHFNKIKTWKSCIPDEVRGQDYDLDSFEKQQVLKKMPSPILHMLPADAKEDDPLPEAKMGVENAPPIIGAVFRRARRENVSFSFLLFHIFTST
ncbi:Bromodomain-containing protein, partial [Morchella snyderi]